MTPRDKTIAVLAVAGMVALLLPKRTVPVVGLGARTVLEGDTGITLRHGQIVVTDPTRAFEWIAIAADPAMREGASAEEVLASVFAQRFPELAWPPPVPGVQWVYMVERVEALLRSPLPPGPARLRVVK
jgi:hypothetical protein